MQHAYPRPLRQFVDAVAPLVRGLQIRWPARSSKGLSLVRVHELLRRTFRMMLYALWRFPSSRWKARHRNSSAVSLHPNTVSSSASDLAVHPRKLLTTTSDQTTNVRLFE